MYLCFLDQQQGSSVKCSTFWSSDIAKGLRQDVRLSSDWYWLSGDFHLPLPSRPSCGSGVSCHVQHLLQTTMDIITERGYFVEPDTLVLSTPQELVLLGCSLLTDLGLVMFPQDVAIKVTSMPLFLYGSDLSHKDWLFSA